MHDAGIMLAAFQFFRHMHDAGSSKVAAGIAQVSLKKGQIEAKPNLLIKNEF